MVKNLFGELALDTTIKSLLQKFGRFSFDSTSSLRVGGTVTANIGTNQTLATVTTANMSVGDTGKNSTVIQASASMFQGTVGKNFNRISIGEW